MDCFTITKKEKICLVLSLIVIRVLFSLEDFRHTTSILELSWISTSNTTNPKIGCGKSNNESAILPSNMEIKYFEMWNHDTNRINIPEKYKYPFGRNCNVGTDRILTSLEILERVLHSEEDEKEYLAADEFITGKSKFAPRCLIPDIKSTRELANKVMKERQNRYKKNNTILSNNINDELLLGLPILNVGFPKAGSTTLNDYFQCIGLTTTHDQNGYMMFQSVKSNITLFFPLDEDKKIKLLKHFRSTRSYINRMKADAFMQLDFNFERGYYPQISLLDEMHEEKPNSTFVFNFRPLNDWIGSVSRWFGMKQRFSQFEVPGLIMTKSQRMKIQKMYFNETFKGNKKAELELLEIRQLVRWWCGHVNHIRNYVKQYPSHKLIELDLYDTDETSKVLYDLFQGESYNGFETKPENNDDLPKKNHNITTTPTPSCSWGHSNTNKIKTVKKNAMF